MARVTLSLLVLGLAVVGCFAEEPNAKLPGVHDLSELFGGIAAATTRQPTAWTECYLFDQLLITTAGASALAPSWARRS